MQHTHQCILEVDQSAMIQNLNYFKSKVKPSTKIIVMVKAFSYGSGDYEIAKLLQNQKISYKNLELVSQNVLTQINFRKINL